ncbi:LacI family DNA-binding transcriptional regulator [Hirschia maritima]|uniref:LacI family DNA-binding transcriptional regulator n=1 Tax=Hirschia maritima TaxID=1121961 RepID=UPI0003722D28|nr:LacI family DNA-binding transcriptional regulator [Hirschia maritima]
MNNKSTITMSDIARIAGVAESTVSRALTGSNRVSQETKDRIKEIVESTGYKINTRARALRTQKSNTIKVVIPISDNNKQHFSDPFFSELIASIADNLSSRGYDLLLSRFLPWTDDARTATSAFEPDGTIFIGQGRTPELFNNHAETGAKFVVWGAHLENQNYAAVGTDNREGGKIVGEHLFKLGRKRIVFLGDVRHTEIGLRHEGCVDAFKRLNHGANTLTVATSFDAQSAYETTKDLLSNGLWHDAIFAATDVIAISAMRAVQELGFRIPDDISIVGYDNIMMASSSSPSLTTIHQDIDLAADALVSKLFKVMNGESVESETLNTELMIRSSCGALK